MKYDVRRDRSRPVLDKANLTMIKGLHDDHDMGCVVRHNQGIQGNQAHQGSDN